MGQVGLSIGSGTSPIFATGITASYIFSDGAIGDRSGILTPTGAQFRWAPSVIATGTTSGPGVITFVRRNQQNFEYFNQIPLSLVDSIGAAGITSFDNNIFALINLRMLCIGNYVSSVTISGAFPWSLSTIGTTSINSFTTTLPNSTYNSSGKLGSWFIFQNNSIHCSNFSPGFNSNSDTNKWVFIFRDNQQTTLTINAEHINRVNISSNNVLETVTINNARYLNDTNWNLQATGNFIMNTDYHQIVSNTSLTNFTINGLDQDTQTIPLKLNFNSNNLSESTLTTACLPTVPANRDIYITFDRNKFTNFNLSFDSTNYPRMHTLSIFKQTNLTQIADAATLPTTFKYIKFSENNVSQCPYFPIGIQTVLFQENPIICTADRPNFRTSMIEFRMGDGIACNFSNWSPNTVTSNNEGLQNCTNLSTLAINSCQLSSWTYQCPLTINAASSSINLSSNRLTTMDMSLLGGYKTVTMSIQRTTTSNYTLTGLTNLHLNTSIEILTLESNYGWALPRNHTNIIQGNWPTQFRWLDLGKENNITTWFKSFTGFATIEATTQFYFRWYCFAPVSVDSVSFILRDMITGTTKIAGTLSFGALGANGPEGMQYPLSTQDSFTQACYNCLTASPSTACNASLLGFNLSTSNTGRGFTVGFGAIS
jgi:hypothetical protein